MVFFQPVTGYFLYTLVPGRARLTCPLKIGPEFMLGFEPEIMEKGIQRVSTARYPPVPKAVIPKADTLT
jgi:hypothetical protein